MERYDYRKAVYNDVYDWMTENAEYHVYNGESEDEIYEKAREEFLNDDSVTGNASGSYTFSRMKAKEYIADNLDLLSDCANTDEYMDVVSRYLKDGDWESLDVVLRDFIISTTGEARTAVFDWLEEHPIEEDIE